jgi:hypothetical protein
VKTKDNGKNSQNKQITRIFPFFWIFPGIFQKALVGIKLFYFFAIFYIFLWTRIKKDVTTKIGTYNWGGMWSIEIQHVLWKACKNFDIFFLYFPEFFWQFWWNQTGWSQVWVGSKLCQEATIKILDFSDKRAKSYACFTEGISSYVSRKAQYGSGS